MKSQLWNRKLTLRMQEEKSTDTQDYQQSSHQTSGKTHDLGQTVESSANNCGRTANRNSKDDTDALPPEVSEENEMLSL